MLRPRESRDLRLVSSVVTRDARRHRHLGARRFGNAVATATFQGLTDHLVIDSVAELQLDADRLAGLRHRGVGRSLSVPLFARRLDRSRRTRGAAISPIRQGGCDDWAAGLRAQQADRHAVAAQGPERRRRADGSAIKAAKTRARSRRSRRSTAAGARAAISPCCSSRRRAAWASAPASSPAICTIPEREREPGTTPCLGGGPRAGRGLDHLRSDQPRRRRLQPHSRRRRARHPSGHAGGRQLHRE